MTTFILTPAAQADVDAIWDYTAGRWGQDQAERYLRGIRDACRELATGERMSRPVDIRAGYSKAFVGSHVLYFRGTDSAGIVVVRILHKRMDADRHL